MSSELFNYSNNIFQKPVVIKYILSNLSYTIASNKPCKSIFLVGKGDLSQKNIASFISLIRDRLGDKILSYKEFICSNTHSRRYCKFFIIEEDDTFNEKIEKNLREYSLILINKLDKLYYLSDSEIIVKVNDEVCYNDIYFDQKILKDEFDCFLTKFINIILRLEHSYPNDKNGEINKRWNIPYINILPQDKHILCNPLILYKEFIPSNYKVILKKDYDTGYFTKYTIDDNFDNLYFKICNWCNKSFSYSYIKEYLIEIFGKPDYYNGWEKRKIE